LREEHQRIQTLPAQNLDQRGSISFPGSKNGLIPVAFLNSSWSRAQIDARDLRKIVFLEASYGFKLTPEEVQVEDYYVNLLSASNLSADRNEAGRAGRDVAKHTLIQRLVRLGDTMAKDAPKVNHRASFVCLQL